MEIYADAVNIADSSPVAYATVQRLYPDGQAYSSPIIADVNGSFNGRVPDTSFKWLITSAGYLPTTVSLTNAVDNDQDRGHPFVVRMTPNDMLPEVVVTPGSNNQEAGSKTPVVAWALAAAVGAYIANDQGWIKLWKK